MAMVEHQGGRQHPTDANKHQYYHHQNQNPSDAIKNLLPNKGPSTSQVLAVVTLVPVGGILLTLSGLTLTGTLIGLALATPVFVIFSPVLVPAALVVALAVAGFLTSGAFGLSGLSSLSWIVNFMRGMNESAPEQMEYAKRRMQDAAGYVGQRTKDLGQEIQKKAGQEGGRGGHEGGRTGHEGGKP